MIEEKVKRVILYCDHWQNGGVEAYMMNQLRHWDISKMECSILTAEKTTEIYDAELQKLKVPQYVLLKGECSSPILRILKTFRAFEYFLQKYPCDILYLNLTNSVTMRYAKIAKRMGIPRRIVHSHSSGIQPGKTYAVKLAAHKWAKKNYVDVATDWWACSDFAAKFMFTERIFPQVICIPNTIETDHFQFCEKQRVRLKKQLFGNETDVKIVGTVGRYSAEKNQTFLLDVFAAIYRHRTDVRLLLVGDGSLRAFLERKAEELGITNACVFYGFTDDVAPLYSAMDVFCLPSVVEGFGIVAIEAQTAGCRCLLSKAVTEQTKILTETRYLPLDKKVWIDNLLEALEKPTDNEMRKKMVEKVKMNGFDVSDNAAEIQKMLMK